MLTKEDIVKMIEWSSSRDRKGGQQTSNVRPDVTGVIDELGVALRFERYKSIVKNKEAIIDIMYDIYKKYYV